MTAVHPTILQSIGNTSLIQLRRLVPPGAAQIFAKLEWQNPTGSMKDRMALGVITKAEQDGRLRPGGTVVEYTGGSTGAALALVCAAKGYNIHVVSSRAFSQEKLDHMVAYGAKLTLIPYEGGGATKKMFLDMIETARRLSTQPNTYWVNQLNNPDTIPGYYSMGEEIWEQMGGEIDAFVHSVGTCASLHGVATALKRHNPRIKIIAVEPGESSVLRGGPPGAHDIEGIGVGFTPPLWQPGLVDEILSVKTDDAKQMARELARKEAIFTGTSSGGNVHAALRLAQQLGPKARIATLMIDSGLKYLSTDVYRTSPDL
ncbi:MAG TPA: cysteine synthase family protein [Terriglobales bacterium]|nr:cysteine synthase family protein [Terriglobales bacterium]